MWRIILAKCWPAGDQQTLSSNTKGVVSWWSPACPAPAWHLSVYGGVSATINNRFVLPLRCTYLELVLWPSNFTSTSGWLGSWHPDSYTSKYLQATVQTMRSHPATISTLWSHQVIWSLEVAGHSFQLTSEDLPGLTNPCPTYPNG